jgi:ABC-2 type transport system permease protein
MRSAITIAKKELSIFLTTPIAYVFFMVTAFFSALFLNNLVERYRLLTMQAMRQNQQMLEQLNLTDRVVTPIFGVMSFVFMICIPFVAMGLLADEKKARTFELLMTYPVRPFQIVLGKYLAGLVVVVIGIAIVALFPCILSMYGENAGGGGSALDWPTVLNGILGLFLFGAMCLSVVLFCSSVTNSSIVAALVSFITLFLLWVMSFLAGSADGPLRDLLAAISSSDHFVAFIGGQIALKDVFYFVSFVVLGLYLTDRAIEGHRWA